MSAVGYPAMRSPDAVPRLAVVIATYNSAADIVPCLVSLRDSAIKTTHTVTVVDNASRDATVAVVDREFPDVTLIRSGQNLGFAAASNLGIRQTTGELVLLLNPDTIVRPGAIDALVATLDARPDAVACGPRLVDSAGRAELSFGPMIGPFNELVQKSLVSGHRAGWPLVSAYVEHITSRPGEPDWVSGACLCVRRAEAEAVGLLDERYFLYAEDVDFCAALRDRGWRILFVPGAQVVHARGQSRASAASASERAYRASQLAFYAKHHPAWVGVLGAYLRLRGRYPAPTE
jgi:N-acetylglucosaminyl-diphospho-decaprenol L-rhamnosyltransferase